MTPIAISETRVTDRTALPRFLLLAVLVAALAFLSRNLAIDDALIYARYVRNALSGTGLVFNPGEPVNALTAPLYSYMVLAFAKALGGHILTASALLSGLGLFGLCAIAETLVPFAGLLIASTGYFYTLVGMESSLFLCLLLLPILLLERSRADWLPTACILLVLTRAEGAALLPFVAWQLYRRRLWPRALTYLPAAFVAVLYLLLNLHWYGRVLPASASAKLGQGRSELWGRWPFAFFDTAYQLKPEFHPTLYVVALVLLLAIPGMIKLRRSSVVQVGLPFLAVLLAFYTLFNIPGYKWYYAPFICFAMVYACAALPRLGGWRWLLAPVVVLSSLSAARRFWPSTFHPLAPTPASDGYPGIAAWLEANAPPGAHTEAAEIGIVGWYCPHCNVQDILGLTSPKNADHIAHRDLHSWLGEDRPDYIVMHRGRWTFEDVARDDPAYKPVPVDFGKAVYLLQRKH